MAFVFGMCCLRQYQECVYTVIVHGTDCRFVCLFGWQTQRQSISSLESHLGSIDDLKEGFSSGFWHGPWELYQFIQFNICAFMVQFCWKVESR
jgi:hypothetical protein